VVTLHTGNVQAVRRAINNVGNTPGPICMCSATYNVHYECRSVHYDLNVWALRSTKQKLNNIPATRKYEYFLIFFKYELYLTIINFYQFSNIVIC